MGHLDILNVGTGHVRVTFDGEDPIETDRARRMITDMLRRGFALFLETPEGKVVPVKKFDETRGVYIVADVPGLPPSDDWDARVDAAAAEQEQRKDEPTVPVEESASEEVATTPRRGRPPKTREVPMAKTRATAVGRTAGG